MSDIPAAAPTPTPSTDPSTGHTTWATSPPWATSPDGRSSAHRLPRAGLDPITDAETALAVLEAVIHHPPRSEVIVLTLDDARCGQHVVVVADTESDDDVLEVAERVLDAAAASPVVDAIVVASVRPPRPPRSAPHGDEVGDTSDVGHHSIDIDDPRFGADLLGPCLDDAEADALRWIELDQIAEEIGIGLVEWFVIGDTVTRPRELADDPPRWW